MRHGSVATWPTCNLSSLFHIYLHMESFSHLGRSLSPLQNTDYFLLTRLTFHSIIRRSASTARARDSGTHCTGSYCTSPSTCSSTKFKHQKWGRPLCADEMVRGSVTEESEETSQ